MINNRNFHLMGILVLINMFILVFLLIWVFAINIDSETVYNNNISKVVEIRCSDDNENWGYATGCFIDKNGTILTNKHVVQNRSSDKVYLYIQLRSAADDEWRPAEFIKASENSDLAIIKANVKSKSYFKIAKHANNGEKAYTVGNPNGYGLSFAEGVISSNSRDVNMNGVTYNMMQTSFVINAGNSGAPVFNKHGKLIGLMSFRLRDDFGEIILGVAFAVPLDAIKEFI